jgi:hypothetical protein
MPKKTRDSIPALVLEVIARVYELSGHRTQPWYVDRAARQMEQTEALDRSVLQQVRQQVGQSSR